MNMQPNNLLTLQQIMSKHEKHHKEEKTEQKPIAEQEQATQEATPTEAEVNEAAPAPAEAKPTTESELAAMKDCWNNGILSGNHPEGRALSFSRHANG